MQHWATFTTLDEFAADESFRQWVESGQFLHPDHPHTVWLDAHPTQQPLALQAADWLMATRPQEPAVGEGEIDAVVAGAWRAIRTREEAETPVRPLHGTRHWAWVGRVAAAVVLLGLGGWWFIGQLRPDPEGVSVRPATDRDRAWIRETNRQATAQLLTLPDGSTVWLAPNSTLRRPVAFSAHRRVVELTGEAFFEIAKNPRQPFFVKTRSLVTRVLGTSFLVRAFDASRPATVQVRTGRVLVYSAAQPGQTTPPRSVTLLANQQVTLQPDQPNLMPAPVVQRTDLAARLDRQALEFNDAPVTAVLASLADAYGLTLDYDEARFRQCRVTTAFSDEPLTEKLSILAEITGARYEVEGRRVRFKGPG